MDWIYCMEVPLLFSFGGWLKLLYSMVTGREVVGVNVNLENDHQHRKISVSFL
jgi:hypothetical protein